MEATGMSLLQENSYIMSELHSLIDFGMCVVLWLVQLVIYPSFLRIEESQLIVWHKTYTFFVSVPLHRKMDQGDPTREFRRQLIRTNWPRTVLWTVIFLLGLMAN